MSLIQATLTDAIGTIAFDHYDKRNALGADLIAQVLAALGTFETQHARAVILRSAVGEKVWSAGHDVDELPRADLDPLPYDDPLEKLLRAVRHFPAPVIAMIHGSVWGGACDLVMNCDIVIGDETAAFAITPAKLGLPYNVSGFLSFMRRLPLVVVKEMFFTADLISADRAERIGLMNALVPAAQLEAATHSMARIIAFRSASSIIVAKEAIRVLTEAAPINPAHYEYVQGMRRDAYFGHDYHEGIQAFLEKRPPNFGPPAAPAPASVG